jgi:selenide,water dikinase
VFRYKNHLLVGTVDVITPIVDDPYTFGAICAANSLSDVYAMGGTPLTALAILGFASCDFSAWVIKRLIKGAVDKLKEAGTCLIGGHSIEDSEFKFGFAITGVVDKDEVLKISGATEGDILILTKPIGTGILTSAFKLNKIGKNALNDVIASMLMLNKTASKTAVLAGANAASDVTGFGLLGHALNIAESSKVNLLIFHEKVPIISRVKEFITSGIIPKGAQKNLEFFGRHIIFPQGFSKEDKIALCDPQTSGGLLIALPQEGLRRFETIAKRERLSYWIIGEVIKGKGKVLIK